MEEDNKIKNWVRTMIIILLVIWLGMFAVNQVLTYYYKAEFLKAPCQLCRDLNPDVDICLTEAGRTRSYFNGSGWSINS